MKLIEDKIRACGEVLPGDVLKVDCFLNHQIDVPLLQEAGKEFFRRFSDSGVNKIFTVEASGIAVRYCLQKRQSARMRAGIPVTVLPAAPILRGRFMSFPFLPAILLRMTGY